MRKKLLLLPWAILLCVLTLKAQTDYDEVPEVTGKIFINDVFLQAFSPDTFLLHDILIDDGIIIGLDRTLEAPLDARIIEADSAYAYPCFIDVFSHAGIPEPERSQERFDIKFRGFPPNDVAGISPENKVLKDIKASDKSLAELRKNGFAISHTVPRGQMLPGKGSIICLVGASSEDMLIKESVSMLFQFAGARGVYPSTVIAVMAKWRELIRQAAYHRQNIQAYEAAPAGKQRPKSNTVLEALYPVLDKDLPVYVNASSAKDIFRALELYKDLGYAMVLANVQMVDPAIELAKTGEVSIVLSADLPEDIKEEKDKEKEQVKDDRIMKLEERKKEAVKEYESQAARLESEGIGFGFSMMDAKASELKDNLRRMIASGLTERTALESLSSTAAGILGIDDRAGSIEAGKLANLFIATGPYFNEESSIKYSIVEGQVEEYEIKKKKSGEAKPDDSLLGEWSFSVDVMGDLNTGTIKIEKSGERMSVSITNDDSPDDPVLCDEVDYKDNTLRLSLTIESQGTALPVNLVLDIEGESYSGTATVGELGTFPIEGSKISSPEK